MTVEVLSGQGKGVRERKTERSGGRERGRERQRERQKETQNTKAQDKPNAMRPAGQRGTAPTYVQEKRRGGKRAPTMPTTNPTGKAKKKEKHKDKRRTGGVGGRTQTREPTGTENAQDRQPRTLQTP